MKYFILLSCMFGVLGLLSEQIFRTMTAKGSLIEKLKKLKLLLMIPVYGLAAPLIVLVYQIPCLQKIIMLPVMMIIGSVISTGFELGFGYLYNIKLKLNIWDYSGSPLNFKGQIDIYHSLIWAALTPVIVYFESILNWLVR